MMLIQYGAYPVCCCVCNAVAYDTRIRCCYTAALLDPCPTYKNSRDHQSQQFKRGSELVSLGFKTQTPVKQGAVKPLWSILITTPFNTLCCELTQQECQAIGRGHRES